MCFKGKGDRAIDVNVRSRQYRDHAKELLTSERGLYHRSMRPIEPEAVFGHIKYDGRFRRFHYRGSRMAGAEFATVAIAHNIKKMISVMEAERSGRRLSPLLAPKEASSLAAVYVNKKKSTNNYLFAFIISA